MAGTLVKRYGLVVAGQRRNAVARAACQALASEPAALINFEHVDRDVIGSEAAEFVERELPGVRRLLRQSCNQVEAEIAESRIT